MGVALESGCGFIVHVMYLHVHVCVSYIHCFKYTIIPLAYGDIHVYTLVHDYAFLHHFCSGNIRVFCRVRPLLPGEGGMGNLDDSTASVDSTSSRGSTHRGRKNSKGEISSANLQIEYPDRDRDRKKIAVQFSGAEVR